MLRLMGCLRVAVLLLNGCESPPLTGGSQVNANDPPDGSIRMAAPDLSFELSDADRARVRQDFDPDALEGLLQLIEPEHRPDMLARFVYYEGVVPERYRGNLVYMNDPILQAELEKVWQPYWRSWPTEALRAADQSPVPGRAAALSAREEAESLISRPREGNDPAPDTE